LGWSYAAPGARHSGPTWPGPATNTALTTYQALPVTRGVEVIRGSELSKMDDLNKVLNLPEMILFGESKSSDPENFMSRPQLLISLSSPDWGPLGTIVVETGMDECIRKRYFTEQSAESDIDKLYRQNMPLIHPRYRISFHPPQAGEDDSSAYLPRVSSGIRPISTSVAEEREAQKTSVSMTYSGPLTIDQIRVAMHTCYDDLQKIRISDALAKDLHSTRNTHRVRAYGSLYKHLDTEEQRRQRIKLATITAENRFGSFLKSVKEGIRQATYDETTGRRGRLAQTIARAMELTAVGERSPDMWED